jgi:hypothetical protein
MSFMIDEEGLYVLREAAQPTIWGRWTGHGAMRPTKYMTILDVGETQWCQINK